MQSKRDFIVQTAYNDWVELLKHTKNEHMLQDPYAVWLEAFHVSSIFERMSIANALQTQLSYIGMDDLDDKATITVAEAKQLQIGLLKKAVAVASG